MTRLAIADLGTILGVWAHPDDEAYLSAGLMALARDNGQRVVVATATRGEAGTPDPQLWPPRRLGRLREHEVHASLAALGVTEHHFLGYVDGTLPEQDEQEAVARIAAIMVAVQPDTIVTFGPEGMTGHTDHCRVSAWTTAARDRVAVSARLLYATTGEAFADRWEHLNERFNIYMESDLPLRTSPDRIALEIGLDGSLADRKLVALRAQASQTTGLINAMGEPTYRAWTSTESFSLAPSAAPQRPGASHLALA